MDPQILAHVRTQCPDGRHPKSKLYISALTLHSYGNIPVAHVTMHCMILP